MQSAQEMLWNGLAPSQRSSFFEVLFQEFHTRVFKFCCRFLSEEDAKDAAMETFSKAIKAFPTFNTKRPLGTWILSIAYHECVNRHRKLVHIAKCDWTMLQSDMIYDPTEQIMLRLSIGEALNTFPDIVKGQIVLTTVYDLDGKEAADMLQVTYSSLRSRVHRSKHRLRKLLAVE